MKGQRIGYIRVSSEDQNLDRQLDGVQVDKVFQDKLSGSTTARPGLEEMISFIREGDTVIVHSMDRLARNLLDLRAMVSSMTARGIQIQFLKENLTFTGEETPMATFLLNVMGAFAEMERAMIRERQREGIAMAKKKGVYKGRKKALSTEQEIEIRKRAAAGANKASLARELGVSRETVYKALRIAA